MKSWSQTAIKLCAVGVYVCASAAVADATAGLAERLAGMRSFAADFTQEVRGAQGQILERSHGLVRVLRPNFKWLVVDPYPQTIVGDGQFLRVYDPDLEQVTLRPLETALANTPISLLIHEHVDIAQQFSVQRAGAMAYRLTPKNKESLYAEIRIVFAGPRLAALAIVDHLGQLTQIEFGPPDENTVIRSDEFVLTLPPGTDVIGG